MTDIADGLMRLFRPDRGDSFLKPHHVEAGRRVARLAQKAHLRHRQTMLYEEHLAGARGRGEELSDMASDARKRLGTLLDDLPAECATIIWEVCVFDKGLQLIEAERQWPRRSAKIILRIALEQLARQWGLKDIAKGAGFAAQRNWRDEGARPHLLE